MKSYIHNVLLDFFQVPVKLTGEIDLKIETETQFNNETLHLKTSPDESSLLINYGKFLGINDNGECMN